ESLGLQPGYPVPHPDNESNGDAYESAHAAYEKWTGPYGANRKYLIRLLIRIAKGEILGPDDVNFPFPAKGTRMSYVKRLRALSTLQEVFDFSVTRVLKNRRPAYNKKHGYCAYRTERIGGYCSVCVVGALMDK